MQALLTLYPALADVQPPLADNAARLQPLDVPEQTVLFDEAGPCQGFPLVLSGEVKVMRRSGDGRSLELYRIGPGELCLVSSACLFKAQPMTARALTTRPTRLVVIAPDLFLAWMNQPGFRAEVLGQYAERMADLTSLIDAVAFQRLDRRLAGALLGRGQHLRLTHQALADELGTVREIITRLLRRFEREGWVNLAREQITILDSAALRACAAPA